MKGGKKRAKRITITPLKPRYQSQAPPTTTQNRQKSIQQTSKKKMKLKPIFGPVWPEVTRTIQHTPAMPHSNLRAPFEIKPQSNETIIPSIHMFSKEEERALLLQRVSKLARMVQNDALGNNEEPHSVREKRRIALNFDYFIWKNDLLHIYKTVEEVVIAGVYHTRSERDAHELYGSQTERNSAEKENQKFDKTSIDMDQKSSKRDPDDNKGHKNDAESEDVALKIKNKHYFGFEHKVIDFAESIARDFNKHYQWVIENRETLVNKTEHCYDNIMNRNQHSSHFSLFSSESILLGGDQHKESKSSPKEPQKNDRNIKEASNLAKNAEEDEKDIFKATKFNDFLEREIKLKQQKTDSFEKLDREIYKESKEKMIKSIFEADSSQGFFEEVLAFGAKFFNRKVLRKHSSLPWDQESEDSSRERYDMAQQKELKRRQEIRELKRPVQFQAGLRNQKVYFKDLVSRIKQTESFQSLLQYRMGKLRRADQEAKKELERKKRALLAGDAKVEVKKYRKTIVIQGSEVSIMTLNDPNELSNPEDPELEYEREANRTLLKEHPALQGDLFKIFAENHPEIFELEGRDGDENEESSLDASKLRLDKKEKEALKEMIDKEKFRAQMVRPQTTRNLILHEEEKDELKEHYTQIYNNLEDELKHMFPSFPQYYGYLMSVCPHPMTWRKNLRKMDLRLMVDINLERAKLEEKRREEELRTESSVDWNDWGAIGVEEKGKKKKGGEEKDKTEDGKGDGKRKSNSKRKSKVN